MTRLIYFINVMYIALTPTLAMIVQGERKHEYLNDHELLPEKISGIMDIALWVFGIMLIAILVQTIKPTENLKASLGLLIGGPFLGFIAALVVGGNLSYLFFNMYLIEGIAFIMVLLVQMIRHRRRGVREAGPIIVYVLTPLLAIVFLAGFLSSINYDFLFKYYNEAWDYIALIGCILFGTIGMYKFIDHTDKEFRKLNPNISFKNGDPLKHEKMDPAAGIALILGLLIFTLHGGLLEWDALTSVLQ